jgi:hypothetical protein
MTSRDRTHTPVLEMAPAELPFSDQMDSVQLLHDVAYLEERSKAGLSLSTADRAQRYALLDNFGSDTGYDPARRPDQTRARRRHRRLPLIMSGLIKVNRRLGRVTLLNMSGGGLFLASNIKAKVGDAVMIKVGHPDRGVQYSFPCEVIRALYERGAHHLALEFSGIPLELRYNRSEEQTLKRAAYG